MKSPDEILRNEYQIFPPLTAETCSPIKSESRNSSLQITLLLFKSVLKLLKHITHEKGHAFQTKNFQNYYYLMQ